MLDWQDSTSSGLRTMERAAERHCWAPTELGLTQVNSFWTFLVRCALTVIAVSIPVNTLFAQPEKPPVAEQPVRSPASSVAQVPATDETADKEKSAKEEEGWRSLLPEKGLEGWEVTDFGSEGEVRREGEQLILEMGDPLTGINLKKPAEFAKTNYEVSVECQRMDGNDFLCGLTFPIGDEFCSFIAGGWGGGLVGLSSINGMDASENSSSSYTNFENGKWYKFRVRVDEQEVRAWIDDKQVIRQEREGYEFSTRIEVYPSQPLGLCVFRSTVAIKDFKWRPLPKEKTDESTESPEAKGAKTDAPPAGSKQSVIEKSVE